MGLVKVGVELLRKTVVYHSYLNFLINREVKITFSWEILSVPETTNVVTYGKECRR